MRRYAPVWFALLALPLLAAPEYPAMGPDIYDIKADGMELIAAAGKRAQVSHKRVIVLLGANWCPWCRRLHRTLTADAAVTQLLARDFELVFVDVNTRRDPKRNAAVNEKYGNPLRTGLPVFLVLGSDGQHLATQPTDKLSDEKGRSADRVVAFLKAWAPPR